MGDYKKELGASTTIGYGGTKTKVKATISKSNASFVPDGDTWKVAIPKGEIVNYNTSGGVTKYKTTNSVAKDSDETLTGNLSSTVTVLSVIRETQDHFDGKLKVIEKTKVQDAVEYGVNLTLTSAQVQLFESIGYNIILMKGLQNTPALTPVWVSEPPAQSLGFSWDEVYGIYYSKKDYKAGVTITVGGAVEDIDLANGCSYYLDDTSSLFHQQKDGIEKGTVLVQNKASYDVVAGLSQVISTVGASRFTLSYAPITASYCLKKSGQTRAQPLVPFTIGLGGYLQSQLYKKSDLNGAASFTLDPSAPTIDLIFDDTSSRFVRKS